MHIKKLLRKKSMIVTALRGFLVFIVKCLGSFLGALTAGLYKILYYLQWKFPFTETPLFFDHDIELYQWRFKRRKRGEMQDWLERGAFNCFFTMNFEQPVLLELGCGNGFYTKRFYSSASRVYACDIDHKGIREAKRWNRYSHIEFIECDFLKNMPCEQTELTNVIWDASINFFTEEQQKEILNNIKNRLQAKCGVLSGSGIIQNEDEAVWEAYDHVFHSEEEIRDLLKPYFSHVLVFRPKRNGNICYFAASNGAFTNLS